MCKTKLEARINHYWNQLDAGVKTQSRAKEKKREKGKPRNRVLTIESKQIVTRGEAGGGMGSIVDGD